MQKKGKGVKLGMDSGWLTVKQTEASLIPVALG